MLIYLLIIVIIFLLYSLIFMYLTLYNFNKNKPLDYFIKSNNLNKESLKDIEEIATIDYEKITIKSYDNKNLFAAFYRIDSNAPVIILFNDLNSNPLIDLAKDVKHFINNGYNVLLTNIRATNNSCQRFSTFSFKETKDALYWINYVNKEFNYNTNIILYGNKLGATIALRCKCFNLPKNVSKIVAYSPYNSINDILNNKYKNKFTLLIAKGGLFLGCLIFKHFNIFKINIIKEKVLSKYETLIFSNNQLIINSYIDENTLCYKDDNDLITYYEKIDKFIK